MDRFEKFNNAYRLFVSTAVAATAALILDRLEEAFKQRSLAWTVLLALVAIVTFILNNIFEGLIEKSVVLRKTIAGDEFIEGHWFDISVDRAEHVVHHGSFLTIWWEGGRFVINGVEFSPNGDRICTFHSTSAAFANRVLTFGYEAHSETFNQAVEIGIDQLQFDNPPQSYSGFYFDFTKTVDFRIQGTRIDQRTVDQYNRFRDVAAKQRFIVEEIARTKKRLGTRASL